ncbi:Gamma-interferon-inducible lysosomal thiol reductase [Halotydeus destructor]|nr:Gamma-interferon-inducible lysosomal thiol reductase [Halotydeus destructor]
MFAALLLLSLGTVTVAEDVPVKVSLYYETLCPYCRDFITGQLYPTFKKVGPILDIDLVPYGNANYTMRPDGSIYYQCQHGPVECYVNQIHSCLFERYTDTEFRLNFLNCTESSKPTRDSVKQCAQASSIDFESLDNCASQLSGQQLEYKMALKTEQLVPPHQFVPWILINDVHSDADQDLAETDLLKLVCTRYTGQPPEACSRYRDTNSMQSNDCLEVIN